MLDIPSIGVALDSLRKKIWHLTFKTQNLVPDFNHLIMQGKRIAYLLGIWKQATLSHIQHYSPLDFGWLQHGRLDWGESRGGGRVPNAGTHAHLVPGGGWVICSKSDGTLGTNCTNCNIKICLRYA